MDRSYTNDVVIGTISGVDYFTPSGVRYFHDFLAPIGVTACAVSDLGDVYYSPTNSGLYVKYSPNSDWTEPDYKVELSGIYPFPIQSNIINDIKLTSISGQNIIFLATRSGLLCYEEYRSNLNISAANAKIFNNFP